MSWAEKKVISIGTVSKLSGLSIRQIRYYEERKLLFPERTEGGSRLYSFLDVERLMEISDRMEEGLHTYEIHLMEKKQMDKRHRERNEKIRPPHVDQRFSFS
jgi:DNA-binding transcriptional MerR regulator